MCKRSLTLALSFSFSCKHTIGCSVRCLFWMHETHWYIRYCLIVNRTWTKKCIMVVTLNIYALTRDERNFFLYSFSAAVNSLVKNSNSVWFEIVCWLQMCVQCDAYVKWTNEYILPKKIHETSIFIYIIFWPHPVVLNVYIYIYACTEFRNWIFFHTAVGLACSRLTDRRNGCVCICGTLHQFYPRWNYHVILFWTKMYAIAISR